MPIGLPAVFLNAPNTLTGTTSQNIVAGNLLVIAVILATANSQTVTSISDGTNSYTKGKELLMGAANTCDFWYVLNAQAVSSGATVTITCTGTPGVSSVAAQVSGINSADTSGFNFSTGTSQTPSTTTNALATTSEIIFATLGAATQTGISSEDPAFANLATVLCNANSGGTINLAYRIVANKSAVAYAPTLNSSQNWGAIEYPFAGQPPIGPVGMQAW